MTLPPAPDPAAPNPASPVELFAFLDRLGIAHRTVTHPAMFTVEEGRDIVAGIPGAHTKNLFLKDKKGGLFLVVALQETVIDIKSLARALACGRLSFGSAELLRATLGVEPGSVTPFALLNDRARRVAVVLDAAMMAHETLNFHPLVNTMTTGLTRKDLRAFLQATGHPPRVMPLSSMPD